MSIIMQHLDIPIKTYDDDKLNFKPFAKKIANGILNYSQNETLIFSLEGQWGGGKTSLINLIENEIKKEVEILHFNPWLLTDIRQVIKLFFDELIRVLSYGSFKTKWNEDIKKDLTTFTNALLPETITFKVPFVSAVYKPKSFLPLNNEESLEKIKSKINGYLKNLDKKIVIIIDDIDRLTDKEIEFIFRLTKGIADFDNLIYILLYDKNIVAKSLEKFKSENGEKYLDKIVQYSLPVPKAHSLTLQNLLFEKLDAIINKLENNEQEIFFDKEKWSYVVSKVINNFIITIRDITKITNTISFEYPIMAEDINFTDFFLISIVKNTNIELYELIKNQPNIFFINPETMILDEEKKEQKKLYEAILHKYPQYASILNLLFPMSSEDEFGFTQSSDKQHNNKYLADMYYFENYFSFSMSDDKLRYKEFKEIEKHFINDDFEEFKKRILMLDKNRKSGLFAQMFNEIRLYKLNDNDNLENAFFNTLKISYQLEEGKYDKYISWTYINPMNRYIHLAYNILKYLNGSKTFLIDFYQKNDDVPLFVKCFLFDKIKKDKISEIKISNTTKDTIFKYLQNELIKYINLSNILDDNFDSFNLIFLHKEFDFSLENFAKELQEFMFKNNSNFFQILDKLKYWQMSSSGNQWLINKNVLKELGLLDRTTTYIENIDINELSNKEKELLEIWNQKNNFYGV